MTTLFLEKKKVCCEDLRAREVKPEAKAGFLLSV